MLCFDLTRHVLAVHACSISLATIYSGMYLSAKIGRSDDAFDSEALEESMHSYPSEWCSGSHRVN